MADDDQTPDDEFQQQLRNSIGAAIRRVRRELRLTQEDVADMLGISSEYYARIERGHALPSISMFHKLVITLDLSADELLGQAPPEAESSARAAQRRAVVRAEPHEDSRELRAIMRRVRKVPSGRVRFLNRLVKGLDEYFTDPDEDSGDSGDE